MIFYRCFRIAETVEIGIIQSTSNNVECNMIRFLLLTTVFSMLVGCSTKTTIYRIETTSGNILYSEDEPDLNDNDYYEVEDLDGNEYKIKSNLLFKVEKYTRKK